MKTGETDPDLATVEFPIFDADGLPASGEAGEGAVYAVAAGELKVRANGGAWGVPINYALTHLGDGIYSFKFDPAEIIKGKIDVRAKKIGTIRTQVFTVEVQDSFTAALGTNAIDIDTFVPRCLRIVSQKLVPGYLTLDVGQPITRTAFRVDAGLGVDFLVNVLVTVTDGTGLGWFAICETYDTATGDATFYGSGFADIIDATSVLSIYPSTVQAPLSRLPAALVGGRMESVIGDVTAFGAYQLQSAVAIATVIPTAATSNTISFKYQGHLNADVITDLDPDTLVGMTITLHNPNLTRDEAPQTRRISAGAYDGGTNTYTATVTPAWSPVPVGTFGDDGGDYVARLWPASTGLATTQDAADILSEVQGVGADLGAVASDVIDLQTDMDTALASLATLLEDVGKVLGLLHHNTVVDKQIWNGKDLLTARLRQFADATAAGAATEGALDDADGEIRRWLLSVEYSATGKPKRFSIVEDPV